MTTWALPFWILEDCVHRVSPREDGLIPVECQHSPSLADLREEGLRVGIILIILQSLFQGSLHLK